MKKCYGSRQMRIADEKNAFPNALSDYIDSVIHPKYGDA